MLAWHFVGKDRKLAHLGWEICEGHKLHHNGTLKLCKSGLHASEQLLDAALQYAPGSVLCRVEVGGRIIRGDDKLVASERTVLWMVDIEDVLHRFALWCARRALFRARVRDPRSWRALRVKRRWLRGDATDDELAVAWAAARNAWAAGAAARDAWAAGAAARDAAAGAAEAAARDAAAWAAAAGAAAAWAAAAGAAWAAARDAWAARDAAGAAGAAEHRLQERTLRRMVEEDR